jgi:hypothetical protein
MGAFSRNESAFCPAAIARGAALSDCLNPIVNETRAYYTQMAATLEAAAEPQLALRFLIRLTPV